jgi:hypothetical protein
MAAVSRLQRNNGLIDEFHLTPSARKKPRSVGGACCEQRSLRLTLCEHADGSSALRAFDIELHLAFREREQRMILTKADVHTRMKSSPSLANQDISGTHQFSGVPLNTKPFGL